MIYVVMNCLNDQATLLGYNTLKGMDEIQDCTFVRMKNLKEECKTGFLVDSHFPKNLLNCKLTGHGIEKEQT